MRHQNFQQRISSPLPRVASLQLAKLPCIVRYLARDKHQIERPYLLLCTYVHTLSESPSLHPTHTYSNMLDEVLVIVCRAFVSVHNSHARAAFDPGAVASAPPRR